MRMFLFMVEKAMITLAVTLDLEILTTMELMILLLVHLVLRLQAVQPME